MANVIGNGSISQIADIDGDPITTANRFPVETEQDDPFGTFVTYPNFEASTRVSPPLSLIPCLLAAVPDATVVPELLPTII